MARSLFSKANDLVVASLVEMRAAAGLTQRQLAEKLGREHSFVGRIETAQRRVDLVEFVTICRACGVDPADRVLRLVKEIERTVPRRL